MINPLHRAGGENGFCGCASVSLRWGLGTDLTATHPLNPFQKSVDSCVAGSAVSSLAQTGILSIIQVIMQWYRKTIGHEAWARAMVDTDTYDICAKSEPQ